MEREEKIEKKESASFCDVLTSVVTSVAHARAVCDREVTQIAQLYKQDQILQAFSVPRLRLEQVVVDIPLNICDVKKAQTVNIESPSLICDRVEGAIDELLDDIDVTKQYLQNVIVSEKEEDFTKNLISKTLFELNKDSLVRQKFIDSTEQSLRKLKNQISHDTDFEFSLSQLQVMIEMKKIFKTCLFSSFKKKNTVSDISDLEQVEYQKIEKKCIKEIADHICKRTIMQSISQEEQKSSLLVNVETDDVKNKTTPGTVMRIQIKMREEGMIWQKANSSTEEDTWNLTLE